MMKGFYRSIDATERCSLARSRELYPGPVDRCPCGDARCVATVESVSWREAVWKMHRGKIVGVCAALIALIAIVAVGQSIKGNPLEKELADVRQQVGVLDMRTRNMESKNTAAPLTSPSELGAKLAARAKELELRIVKFVGANEIEKAKADLQALESLPKQIDALRNEARGPRPASGALGMELQQLLGDWQAIGDTAQGVAIKNRSDTKVAAEAESLIGEIDRGVGRTRKLLPMKESSAAQGEIAKFVGEAKASVLKGRGAVAQFVPPPNIPFTEQEATLVVATTSELAESLVLPLFKGASHGEVVAAPGELWYYTSKLGAKSEAKVIIRASGDGLYRELAEGTVDLVVADRIPEADEVQLFSAKFPGKSLTSRALSEVVALDAVTLLANPESQQADITAEQSRATPWIAGPVGSVEHSIAKRFGFRIDRSAERPEDAVLEDRQAKALNLFHKERGILRAKRLAFKAGADTAALKPSPFTIATEDYKFAFRILASYSPNSRPGTLEFIRFVTSEAGQDTVAAQGYVDRRLRSEMSPDD